MGACASQEALDSSKVVVIVGGGMAGLFLAKALAAKGASVTLVDPKEYWDFAGVCASPRCATEPADIDKHGYAGPYTAICAHIGVKFVQASVHKVTNSGVTLANGENLAASVVVVAIGGRYAGNHPWKANDEKETTRAARIATFEELNRQIESASTIVVSGAGLVGTEVAGEIKCKYPDKEVTLCGNLAPNISPKLGAKTESILANLGVARLKGDRVVGDPSGGFVALKSGGTVKCDLHLPCAGFKFDNAIIADAFPDACDARGQIITEPTLLVKGATRVFAIGDVVKVPEGMFKVPSGMMHCEAMAQTAAANVVSFLKDGIILSPLATEGEASPQSPSKMNIHPWKSKPSNTPCISAFGPGLAAGDMGMPSMIEDAISRNIKSTSFFEDNRVKFGYKKSWGKKAT